MKTGKQLEISNVVMGRMRDKTKWSNMEEPHVQGVLQIHWFSVTQCLSLVFVNGCLVINRL